LFGLRIDIHHALIKARLVNQSWLLAHGGHRWIVRVQGHHHTGLLGHGQDFIQETRVAVPELVVRGAG
jgi:hypothetical protein